MSGRPPAEDPYSASHYPSVHDRTQPKDEGSKQRLVLLLEDNPTDVYVIKEVLKNCDPDFRVVIMGNGRDALRFLQDLNENPSSACPVLVLLDLNVPKVDGIEVLRHLRHATRCGRTPAVVVTSSAAPPDRAAALKLGADAYFEKPKDLSAYMELANVIQGILNPT